MIDELATTKEVFEALGGIQAVADLTGRDYSAAAQDNRLGKFPSRTYKIMTEALAAKGRRAPASLWGQVAAQDQAAAS